MKTSIVGLGQTEFSKNSGRSELRLAMEAILAAIEDAGLEVNGHRWPGTLHLGQYIGSRSR